jgi:hypothetical protein
MGTMSKSAKTSPSGTKGGTKNVTGAGAKKRSATTESHGASRVEPSKITQKKRDVREKKVKAAAKK